MMDWAAGFVVQKSALATFGTNIGDALWTRWVMDQTTSEELALVRGTVNSLETYQAEAARLEQAQKNMEIRLPVFKQHMVAAVGQARPRLRQGRNKQEVQGERLNTAGYKWEANCMRCGMANHPTAKCRRNGPADGKTSSKTELNDGQTATRSGRNNGRRDGGRELKGLACDTCGKLGHVARDCPDKSSVRAFLVRMHQAGEQFANFDKDTAVFSVV